MIDDTGPRITALERRVAEIEARMVAQPIPSANSSDAPTLAYAMEGLRRFPYWPEVVAVLAAWDRERPDKALLTMASAQVEVATAEQFSQLDKMRADRDAWKARAEAADKLLEQVLLWWRAEEELSMSDIVEKIRAHLQKGTP